MYPTKSDIVHVHDATEGTVHVAFVCQRYTPHLTLGGEQLSYYLWHSVTGTVQLNLVQLEPALTWTLMSEADSRTATVRIELMRHFLPYCHERQYVDILCVASGHRGN